MQWTIVILPSPPTLRLVAETHRTRFSGGCNKASAESDTVDIQNGMAAPLDATVLDRFDPNGEIHPVWRCAQKNPGATSSHSRGLQPLWA
jgi:hypothetical protein